MLMLTKPFGNTGYDIGCYKIRGIRILVEDNSAEVELGGYRDANAATTGDPVSIERVTLRDVTGILGKTYLENIEAALTQTKDYEKAVAVQS